MLLAGGPGCSDASAAPPPAPAGSDAGRSLLHEALQLSFGIGGRLRVKAMRNQHNRKSKESKGGRGGCPCFDHWKGKAKIELKNPARQNRVAAVLMVVFP